ncbi:MAG: cytochrome b/b6 domain-containing protein [Rhodospirillaceae bacterium]|nr:cytochrome b/b6 domain-containing protein [Rhodospirillaceae bacterium]
MTEPAHTDTAATPSTSGPTRKIKVWDVPVRLFHWILVLLIGLSYATGEFGGFDFIMPVTGNMVPNMNLHMWSGLSILALVIFRVVWGVLGSDTAKFSDFVKGPGAVMGYLGGLFKKGTKVIAGHNPAGGLVVVAILILLLMQAGTGLFAKEDDFFGIAGPLNSLVSEDTAKMLTSRHHQIWEAIEILIVLHIAASIFYWLVLKQNLIVAMFTGQKEIPASAEIPQLRFASKAKAAVVMIIAAAVVWGITQAG